MENIQDYYKRILKGQDLSLPEKKSWELILENNKNNEDSIAYSEDERKIYSKDLEIVKKNNGKIYLAKENDKVVGLIMGIIREPESDFDYCRPNKLGEVIELIVTKNIRSKGIGKTLLDKMEEYFKDNQCKTINIDVFGYNDIGKSFYKKEHYHDRLITMSKKI